SGELAGSLTSTFSDTGRRDSVEGEAVIGSISDDFRSAAIGIAKPNMAMAPSGRTQRGTGLWFVVGFRMAWNLRFKVDGRAISTAGVHKGRTAFRSRANSSRWPA